MEDYLKTLSEFEERFSTEDSCRDYLFQLRWPNGFQCSQCGHKKAWPIGKALFQCAECDHQTAVIAVKDKGIGFGRIRLRHIVDATAKSLNQFVLENIEPGNTIRTDGWDGYNQLIALGYNHTIASQESSVGDILCILFIK